MGVVWIHFFIGDTQGNNTWLGHYNGNCPMKRPHCDCWCKFAEMCLVNHRCVYVTLLEINQAYAAMREATTDKKKRKVFKRISKHPVKNAFIHGDLSLSDLKRGPFKMTPPELLQNFVSDIIMYIFSVLESGWPKSDLCTLDELHKDLMALFYRQSQRDFLRGANRNGLVDGTKCQSTERCGNLLLLLWIAHTAAGQRALQKYFVQVGITHGQFCDCINSHPVGALYMAPSIFGPRPLF